MQMNAVEILDFLQYQVLNKLRTAPGGDAAAFLVTTCSPDGSGYENRIWLYRDGGIRKLTDGGKETAFFWEDETHILFSAALSPEEQERKKRREQFTSWYRLDIGGGEPEKAFELPMLCMDMKHLEGSKWFFTSRVDPAEPDLWCASPERKADAAKKQAENADYHVIDFLPMRFNGMGYASTSANALFLYDMQSGELQRVSAPDFNVMCAIAHEGKIVYSGEPKVKLAVKYNNIYVYDPASGTTEAAYAKKELSILELLRVENEVVVIARDRIHYGFDDDPKFYTLDFENRALRVLAAPELNLESSVCIDCSYGSGYTRVAYGGELYFLTTVGTDSVIYKVDLQGGISKICTHPGAIDCFDITADGAIYGVCHYDMGITELYRLGELPEKCSDFNDDALADRYVAQPQPLSAVSCGETIDGFVLLPKDYDPAKTYPAVLNIHGGPKNVFSAVFYHQQQVWAGMGYFVVFCNPFGSDGRGPAFCQQIRQRYGTYDYQSTMDFLDAALEKYPQIDRTRLAVEGGSYGGYLTNWIIGHTDRFACAVSQRSISNMVSMYGTSDVGYNSVPDKNGGDIFKAHDLLWEQSPLKYADRVTTPTLFIHSDEDYRCPLEQGIQMFTAVKARGVDAKMVIFKGENHSLSRSGKPKHRVRRLEEITAWVRDHI